jgi:hypothetical protein
VQLNVRANDLYQFKRKAQPSCGLYLADPKSRSVTFVNKMHGTRRNFGANENAAFQWPFQLLHTQNVRMCRLEEKLISQLHSKRLQRKHTAPIIPMHVHMQRCSLPRRLTTSLPRPSSNASGREAPADPPTPRRQPRYVTSACGTVCSL